MCNNSYVSRYIGIFELEMLSCRELWRPTSILTWGNFGRVKSNIFIINNKLLFILISCFHKRTASANVVDVVINGFFVICKQSQLTILRIVLQLRLFHVSLFLNMLHHLTRIPNINCYKMYLSMWRFYTK